jgi:hypothetical protein
MRTNPSPLITIIFTISILVGCGGGGTSSSAGVSNSADTSASSLSLTNVNQMLVAPQDLSIQTTASRVNKFFKVLIAGFGIKEAFAAATTNTTYTIDTSGKINPTDLAGIVAGRPSTATSDLLIDSPKFLLFLYSGLNKAATNEQCVLVGVRKSDGKIACINSNPRCDTATNPNNVCNVSDYRSQIKVDPSGNIFSLVLGDGSLETFDLTNPDSPKYSTIFTNPAVGAASFPIVNRYSDIWTSINLNNGPDLEYRIYKASGGEALYSVPPGRSVTCAFAGPDTDNANFYYIANINGSGALFNMYKLTRSPSGAFTESLVASDNRSGQDNTLWMNSGGCAQMAKFGQKIYSIGYNQTQMPGHVSNLMYELMSNDIALGNSLPVTIQLSNDILFATNLKAHETGLVVAGLDASETSHVIQRFNPGTNQLTTVLNKNSYRINTMTVAKNGDITFTGIQLLGGANVIATIPSATNLLTAKALSAQPVGIGSIN